MIHIKIIFILLNITFALDTLKLKTDYFKDFNLGKLNIEAKDILTLQPLKQFAGDYNYITQSKIDSIVNNAYLYEPSPISNNDTIFIETTKGTIKLQYFTDIAPKHCYNFKKLANSGFYDNTTFHRVIKDFMIQGGDILSRDSKRDNDGTGGPGWKIDQEFNSIQHDRGILSMARGPSPNSAGSQFFICLKDAHWLDGNYTAFGRVIENIHVIDFIADTPTDYIVAKTQCHNTMPPNQKSEEWIELIDPKSRKKLFAKIPDDKNKNEYYSEMMKLLRSDNPSAPVTIKKIRVKDGN
ncbi:MAG: hypothetical protein CMG26_04475 [Candidatus Marinimicrobia bacterium]|mgnify:FL=1|nr:hypothetical protein [Candidatus Neomarinimicrobiota bacterium]|tara:strand:- start:7979 stop:8866 length:888 start_codon:yes stop_codon:yes gene_type:complete